MRTAARPLFPVLSLFQAAATGAQKVDRSRAKTPDAGATREQHTIYAARSFAPLRPFSLRPERLIYGGTQPKASRLRFLR